LVIGNRRDGTTAAAAFVEGVMKIAEIMSAPVVTCTPETWLARAAHLMQNADCGILPVIDSDRRVVGIITDRDICLAIAASHRSPRAIAVHEVMTKRPVTVRQDDELTLALAAMTQGRVRRLPVLDASGHLIGLLSLDDIVIRGLEMGAVGTGEIVHALRALYERRPALVAHAAVTGSRRAAN
jgi:CBS domain-containing protein